MTTRGRITVIAAGVATLLASGVAVGADDELRRIFEGLDRDGDGVVTRVEFDANKTTLFFEAEPAENVGVRREDTRLTEAAFTAADTNGDGVLSGAEFVRAPFMQFEKIDLNSDGQLTFDEFQALAATYLAP